MFPFLTLFSCALQSVDMPSELPAELPSELDGELPAELEGGTGIIVTTDGREATSYVPDQVLTRLPRFIDGFVELRAYREDKDGVVWTGRPMVTFELEAEGANLALPPVPPAMDRVDALTPVTYAISLRLADGRGRPGVYAGIAEARVVYMPEAEGDAPKGWNIAVGYGEADEAWFPLSTMVYFGENLLGPDRLALGGITGLPTGPETRIVVLTDVPGAPPAYDGALARDWEVPLGRPPADEALEDEALGGTALTVYAYKDADGDGAFTTEPVSGEACSPFGPAVVTWYQPPRDLRAALGLASLGLRGGWGVGMLDEDGYRPLPRSLERALVLDEACR